MYQLVYFSNSNSKEFVHEQNNNKIKVSNLDGRLSLY